MKTSLTAERARQLLSYDPETGEIRRRERSSNSVHVGDVAGYEHPVKHYIYLYVDGSRYFAHRIAWLIHYGEWPKGLIDHINRERTDNRIANLRDADAETNSQNIGNIRSNTSGLAGVSWMTKAHKWRAQISVNRKVIYLGLFDSKEEAHATYLQAKRQAHAGCTI